MLCSLNSVTEQQFWCEVEEDMKDVVFMGSAVEHQSGCKSKKTWKSQKKHMAPTRECLLNAPLYHDIDLDHILAPE